LIKGAIISHQIGQDQTICHETTAQQQCGKIC
jgi:hypothetical protein